MYVQDATTSDTTRRRAVKQNVVLADNVYSWGVGSETRKGTLQLHKTQPTAASSRYRFWTNPPRVKNVGGPGPRLNQQDGKVAT
jgi:hypothetical protein